MNCLLNNSVLHGFLVESLFLLFATYYFGWLAALMFCYQGYAAVRILETVNYFQHWGLENGQFGNTYGWVCHSPVSHYTLIGLTHHIGHHLDATRQFQCIPFSDRGPKLPYGYIVMNLWVKLANASYQKAALKALSEFQLSTSIDATGFRSIND